MKRIINKLFQIFNSIHLRSIGVKLGDNSDIKRKVVVERGRGSVINIGNNFTFYSGSGYLNPLSRNIQGTIRANDNAAIKIGNNVGISSSSIWAHKSITIGNNVTIGANCTIVDSDCHSLDHRHRGKPVDLEYKIDLPIVIEDDVLIGAQSIILKGVTIGERSVIGAGSVVTKNIPPDVIAAGNPCRVIKRLEFNLK